MFTNQVVYPEFMVFEGYAVFNAIAGATTIFLIHKKHDETVKSYETM